jgi:hypothetical protein
LLWSAVAVDRCAAGQAASHDLTARACEISCKQILRATNKVSRESSFFLGVFFENYWRKLYLALSYFGGLEISMVLGNNYYTLGDALSLHLLDLCLLKRCGATF